MEGGRTDDAKGFAGSVGGMVLKGARGVTAPATLSLRIAIGGWLMFTRVIFGNTGSMANSDYVVGALVITFSIIAWAEVARSVRWINLVFGAWLLAAPWLLDGLGSTVALANSMFCGVLLALLALRKGAVRNKYAGWDRYIV